VGGAWGGGGGVGGSGWGQTKKKNYKTTKKNKKKNKKKNQNPTKKKKKTFLFLVLGGGPKNKKKTTLSEVILSETTPFLNGGIFSLDPPSTGMQVELSGGQPRSIVPRPTRAKILGLFLIVLPLHQAPTSLPLPHETLPSGLGSPCKRILVTSGSKLKRSFRSWSPSLFQLPPL